MAPTPQTHLKNGSVVLARRQERLLNGGRDFEFLIDLGLVERLAIQPGVLDRDAPLRR